MFESKLFTGFFAFLGMLGIALFVAGNTITGTLKEEINFIGTVLLGIFALILLLKIVDMKLQESNEEWKTNKFFLEFVEVFF